LGEEVVRVKYEFTEHVPLIHVPIPGRRNPVLVVPTTNKVRVEAEVIPEGKSLKLPANIPQEVVEVAANFYSKLLEEVGISASVGITAYVGNLAYVPYAYIAVTNAVVGALGGGVDEEILWAATTVDSALGVGDGVKALRFSAVKSRPYVWRSGEGIIEASREFTTTVSTVAVRDLSMLNEPVEVDALTHLAGMAVVTAFRALEKGGMLQELIPALRLANALWHALYGVELPATTRDETHAVVEGLRNKAIVLRVRNP